MVTLPSSVQENRSRALRHLRELAAHPDAAVQHKAKAAEAEVTALPVALDGYLESLAPPGMQLASADARIRGIPVQAREARMYLFRRPVKLRVVLDGEYYVAFSPAFLVHATGNTVEEALERYFAEWHAHYRTLHDLEQRGELGKPLQAELARIRRRLRDPEPIPVPLQPPA